MKPRWAWSRRWRSPLWPPRRRSAPMLRRWPSMPDLDTIAAPLGAECDPDDTLIDVLDPLRAQHPLPLLVTREAQILGTVGLEAVIPAFGSLGSTRVGDVMRPAPSVDAGERVERGAAALR